MPTKIEYYKIIELPVPPKKPDAPPENKIKRQKRVFDPDRPVRARSAYNFFYQFQRKILLNAMCSGDIIDEDNIDQGAGSISNCQLYDKSRAKCTIEIHTELRKKYDELFGTTKIVSVRTKRPHRKTHGKIEMKQLTKLVALRWKNASEDIKSFFQIEADKDSFRYKSEMRRYAAMKSLREQSSERKKCVTSNNMINPDPQKTSMNINARVDSSENFYPHKPKQIPSVIVTSSIQTFLLHDNAFNESKKKVQNDNINLLQTSDDDSDLYIYRSSKKSRVAKGSLYGYDVSPDRAKLLLRSKPSWLGFIL